LKVPKPSGLVPDWAKTPAVFGPDPAIKTSAKVAKKVSSKATAKTPSKATTKAATKTRVKAATKASKAVTKHASKETVLEVSDSEPESIDEFGGLPEEVDQTRNRAAAHRQVDSVQSRNTSQVGVWFCPVLTFYTIYFIVLTLFSYLFSNL
jgi:cobalamin biosynthesis Mg chelatase CobN